MIDMLKRLFTAEDGGNKTQSSERNAYDVKVAVCALFVEMAGIDESFTDEELNAIILILKEKYDLSGAHADALIEEATSALEKSVDLWQFANLINENYTHKEKIEVIEMLWRIVFVDKKMDQYENYLMHKLSNLLRLSHKELIDAKLKVLHPKGRSL